jgi:hypothetical protein
VYDDLASLRGDQTRQDYAFAPPNLREQLRTDLLFSGEFDRLATGLAWRIAAREAGSDSVPASAIESERARFFERSGVSDEMLDRWLLSLGRDAVWFKECWSWKPSSGASGRRSLPLACASGCCPA